jgi:hypothetical protein
MDKMKKYNCNTSLILLSVVSLLLSLYSCTNRDDKNSLREQTIKELNLPATINFSESDTALRESLSEDLTKQLYELNKNQLKDKSKIKFNYHDKWNIGYRIKSDKDFDIMVVQQEKDAKIKCLVTISKKKPIRIISSIIVALDNYNETKGVLESENWTSEISPDLTVKVNKHYEKILDEDVATSSKGSNVENNHDLYKILPDGKIEFISKNEPGKQDSSLLKKYDAVIIFMNKPADEAPQLSEDWLLYNTEVENYCATVGIQVQYCYDNFTNVTILNPKKKAIAKLNIQKSVDQYGSGYIFASDDTPLIYVPFGPSEETIKYIKQYFKITSE